MEDQGGEINAIMDQLRSDRLDLGNFIRNRVDYLKVSKYFISKVEINWIATSWKYLPGTCIVPQKFYFDYPIIRFSHSIPRTWIIQELRNIIETNKRPGMQNDEKS